VQPSGSADPFGLRRAALAIVNNLIAAGSDFPVSAALAKAAQHFRITMSDAALSEAGDFITRRLQGVLLEIGYPNDVVEAVLAVRGDNPYRAERACAALAQMIANPGWAATFTAYARCARIVRTLEGTLELAPDAYETAAEEELDAAYRRAAIMLSNGDDPAQALGEALISLQQPINAFFDAVMVNAEDPRQRQARQALVQRIARLPQAVADLSRLQGF
jgi:glycyl-tRNA synthetase